MYIVVSTRLEEDQSFTSDWNPFETIEEATLEYQLMLEDSAYYTASICSVIESTDYSPAENNKIGDLDRLNQDL